MQRLILVAMTGLALSACGLGETAVSSAAGAAAELEQAKAGLKTEALAKQRLDAATALESQHRAAAEAESQ